MEQDFADLYAVLGVDRHAGADAIEAAFVAWNKRADAGEPFDEPTRERVRYAYDVLITPSRRAVYDSLVAETTRSSVSLDLSLSAETLPLLDTPQIVYALVTLRPQQPAGEHRRPLNLGLVIDRSTSMRGERLDRVTAAVGLLLDKLGPEDTLALVSFSDRAEVVLPAATKQSAAASDNPETVAAWRDPRARLGAIAASGGTEIYHGLRAGLGQIARSGKENTTSHLILLTDGHTYGDEADCLRLANEAAARGIGLTAFGLGADWNDAFLDALVAPSGGQSHFIEQPADILPHLEDRLQGLGDIHARNLSLRSAWPAPVTLRNGFKLAPFPQPLSADAGHIPLGDLEGRSPVSLLLELVIAPHTVPARLRVPLEVEYTTTGGAAEKIQRLIQLVIMESPADGRPPGASLIEAVRRFTLYRMQEKAWEEAQSGKLDTAAARMRRLTAHYMETGDLRLARQAQLESQTLAHMGTMSPEGRKRLKYGTRSLMGQLKS